METHEASEYMKKFFANLQELKEYIKSKADATKDRTLVEIYNKLDRIFKVQ